MRVRTGLSLICLLCLFVVPASTVPSASGLPIRDMYVLGDSLSDQGNIYFATSVLGPPNGLPVVPAADHYYQGRFSNGEVYAGLLARRLGFTLTPSLAGGHNFAFGGARTDYSVAEVPLGPYPVGTYPWSLDRQRQAFLDSVNPHADPTTLYVVFSGSNDVADILRLGLDPGATIAKTVTGIRNVVLAFKSAGAKNVLVMNLPDLGRVPEIAQFGPVAAGFATALSVAFNTTLDGVLDTVSGVNIIRFDTFGFMTGIALNPSPVGLTNVTTPCYSGFVNPNPSGVECSNPDQYLFWDVEHPTRRLHALLADALFTSVLQCEATGSNKPQGTPGKPPLATCNLDPNGR